MGSNTKKLSLILSALLLSACGGGGGGGAVSRLACPADAAANSSAEAEVQYATEEMELYSAQTDRWIVGLKTKALQPSGQTTRRFTVNGLDLQYEIVNESTLTIEAGDPAQRQELHLRLQEQFEVEFIEPDYKVHLMSSVDATSLARQWAHSNIGTQTAWQHTEGTGSVVVAVVDSGVDFSHPELKGSEWKNPIERANGIDDDGNGFVDDFNGWNFVDRNNKPRPPSKSRSDFHGTHVAGIIAGRKNSAKGVAGVAPKVKLMALRFLNGNGAGNTSDAIKAIRYATDKNAKVINASFGSYRQSQAMSNEIKRAGSKGVLIIAAAGNLGQNNDSRPFYPASYPHSNIVSVTASSSSNKWVSGINYGVRSVDIAAPGSKILSTDVSHGYVSRTGSSMAAPFVAGVAALVLSANQGLSAAQVKSALLSQASVYRSLAGRVAGSRRLNAATTTKVASESRKGGPVIPDVPLDCDL